MKTKEKAVEIEVASIQQGETTFCILGTTPFYCNRVTEKAKQILLYPRGAMTRGERASNLKHDPMKEFRDSPYLRPVFGETLLMMKATAFKGAIAQSAIDMPTAVAKAQIDRLVYVLDDFVPVWGIPALDMDVVKQAGIQGAPDIRTRARLQRWASMITVRYIEPMLTSQSVGLLLSAAGLICGVGDFRQQKGKGNNGLFTIVDLNDKEFKSLVANGGHAAQTAALENPGFSNSESEELYHWYCEEILRRRPAANDGPKAKPGRKPKINPAVAWTNGGVPAA